MKLVLEDNVDLLAVRCPYFLERCISVIVRASVLLVDSRTVPGGTSTAVSSSYTHVALTSSSLQAASAMHVNSADVDQVWQALRRIAPGATTSYGSLSAAIGKPAAVRALGAAVGRNPISIVVPCHRVLGADGSLTGYAGGLERKTALLSLEGAALSPSPHH